MGSVTERLDGGVPRVEVPGYLDRLGAAVDRASLCIAVLVGRALRFAYVNPAYQALAPETLMIGRRYGEVFPEAARAGAEAAFQRALHQHKRESADEQGDGHGAELFGQLEMQFF